MSLQELRAQFVEHLSGLNSVLMRLDELISSEQLEPANSHSIDISDEDEVFNRMAKAQAAEKLRRQNKN